MTTTATTTSFLAHEVSPPSKASLKAWWRSFAAKPQKAQKEDTSRKQRSVFGIPLRESIQFANVAISMSGPDGKQYIYGYIPIVVAKCGLFIKERGTEIEGIFRVSGSAKRIKELQTTFDTPPKYGKNLNWDGFTVHDAANVLRRYLNDLPEPLVPYELYQDFRNVLSNQPIDHEMAIKAYKLLITSLPQTNQHLLLYVLDLLAVIAAKSDINLMTARNLAVICQPGILSHPSHDMTPAEFQLSQDVLEFLINNQEHFLFGMGRINRDAELPPLKSPLKSPGRSLTQKSISTTTTKVIVDLSSAIHTPKEKKVHARCPSSSDENSPTLERRRTTVTTPGVHTVSDAADALAVAARKSGSKVRRSLTVPTKRRGLIRPDEPGNASQISVSFGGTGTEFENLNIPEQRRYSTTTTSIPPTTPIRKPGNLLSGRPQMMNMNEMSSISDIVMEESGLSKIESNKSSSTSESTKGGAQSMMTSTSYKPILDNNMDLKDFSMAKNKPNKLIRKSKNKGSGNGNGNNDGGGFKRVE